MSAEEFSFITILVNNNHNAADEFECAAHVEREEKVVPERAQERCDLGVCSVQGLLTSGTFRRYRCSSMF